MTYVEELDVVQDVVVVGEVIGRDDVDASVLLDLPVGESQPLALGEEVSLRELFAPVGLVGLLEVPKDANAAVGSKQSAPKSREKSVRRRGGARDLRETQNG